MNDSTNLQDLKNFIFNDDVQNTLSKIDNSVMDFNILEITGMGDQEIKHSNLIGWLFGDNEHDLGYSILEGFLKKVAEEANNEKLKHYIYLTPKPRKLTIFRERDNIDLLLVDEANKIIIAIKNKVYAGERIDGEDGGQLVKYEDKVQSYIDKKFEPFFIFLTLDFQDATRDKWLKASHQMIGNTVQEILNAKHYEISEKAKLILSSYIDLLKRRGIIMDQNIESMCQALWKNHSNALKIIMNNRPGLEEFKNKLREQCISKFGNDTKFDDYTKTGSDFAVHTPNWQKIFSTHETPAIRFGVYITKNNIQFWVRYEGDDDTDRYGSIFTKIKMVLNKKGKKRIDIFANNFDGFNIDEVGDSIIEEFIEYIAKIDTFLTGGF